MNPSLFKTLRYGFHARFRKTFGLPLLTRLHLPAFLTALGLRGKGVEVGVLTGDYAEVLLKFSRLSLLIAVDPWKHFPQEEYPEV